MWVGVRSYASALAYMMSLFGGVVADSFLGKYRVRTTQAVAVAVAVNRVALMLPVHRRSCTAQSCIVSAPPPLPSRLARSLLGVPSSPCR